MKHLTRLSAHIMLFVWTPIFTEEYARDGLTWNLARLVGPVVFAAVLARVVGRER